MKGRLQIVAAGESDERLKEARKQQWTQISPSARASFAISLIPGLGILNEDREREEEGKIGRKGGVGDPDPPEEEPTDAFCLVLLWPNCVDHLMLAEGQTRHVHRLVEERDGEGGYKYLQGDKEGTTTATTIAPTTAVSSERERTQEEEVGPQQQPAACWTSIAVNP